MKPLVSIIVALSLLGLAVIPAGAATCAAGQTPYTVKFGDALFKIGRTYGVAWPDIAAANKLANPNLIYPGQVLCIPAAPPTPTPTPGPAPVPTPFVIPTFSILSVVANKTVTIRTANFPANQKFDVLMGPIGTRGVNGTFITTTNSVVGGSFTATYNIPANLGGARQIAVRLQSASGYFSYNWFFNNTTP